MQDDEGGPCRSVAASVNPGGDRLDETHGKTWERMLGATPVSLQPEQEATTYSRVPVDEKHKQVLGRAGNPDVLLVCMPEQGLGPLGLVCNEGHAHQDT